MCDLCSDLGVVSNLSCQFSLPVSGRGPALSRTVGPSLVSILTLLCLYGYYGNISIPPVRLAYAQWKKQNYPWTFVPSYTSTPTNANDTQEQSSFWAGRGIILLYYDKYLSMYFILPFSFIY